MQAFEACSRPQTGARERLRHQIPERGSIRQVPEPPEERESGPHEADRDPARA